MFHRGQRIIIKESSASKRAHPNVGDIGYMGSSYLFYRDRFILIDAEFFSNINSNRIKEKSERKRFIVDLGMYQSTKNEIRTYGISRNWFVKNKYVINLSPVSIGPYLGDSGIHTIWPSTNGDIKMLRQVKIPIGHLSLLKAHKEQASNIALAEFKAWVRVMSPFVELANSLADCGDIRNKLSATYAVIKPYTTFSKTLASNKDYLRVSNESLNNKVHRELIAMSIRRMQAICAMQWNKRESFLIYNYVGCDPVGCDPVLRALVGQRILSAIGFTELIKASIDSGMYGALCSDIWRAIIEVLARAFFMQGDTYNRIILLRDIFGFDFSTDWYARISEIINEIKGEAINHSAALARIFDSALIR